MTYSNVLRISNTIIVISILFAIWSFFKIDTISTNLVYSIIYGEVQFGQKCDLFQYHVPPWECMDPIGYRWILFGSCAAIGGALLLRFNARPDVPNSK